MLLRVRTEYPTLFGVVLAVREGGWLGVILTQWTNLVSFTKTCVCFLPLHLFHSRLPIPCDPPAFPMLPQYSPQLPVML